MDLEFAGKVIALTGASRGACLAVAEKLAAEGAAVAIAARSAAELADAHAAIEGHGGRCLAYACDLAVPGEAAVFIASVVEVFGRLDGLVCNGAMALKGGSEREAWQAELALNVGHAVEAIEAAAPVMKAAGCVLLLTSDSQAWPVAASKAALGEAARHFAGELARREIRINQLTCGDRAFADAAVFLLSVRSVGLGGEVIKA